MKYKFKISGLDCPNCAAKLAAIIGEKDGIDEAKINFLSERVTVVSDLDLEEAYDIVALAAKKFDPDITVEK